MMQSIIYIDTKNIFPINQAIKKIYSSRVDSYTQKQAQKLPSYCLQSYSKFFVGYTARFINTIRNNVTHIIVSTCELTQSCLLKRINYQEITHRRIFIPKEQINNDKKHELVLKGKRTIKQASNHHFYLNHYTTYPYHILNSHEVLISSSLKV